jgi:hypothetical protein
MSAMFVHVYSSGTLTLVNLTPVTVTADVVTWAAAMGFLSAFCRYLID